MSHAPYLGESSRGGPREFLAVEDQVVVPEPVGNIIPLSGPVYEQVLDETVF